MGETIKKFRSYLPFKLSADDTTQYSQLSAQAELQTASCMCLNCGQPVHGTPFPNKPRRRWALSAILSLVATALWLALVSALVMVPQMRVHEHIHEYVEHAGPKDLIDQFPIVYENWQYDSRYIESDPWQSPFLNGNLSLSDDLANAWNSYGNAYIFLRKDSPYSIPGGRPLIPLKPEDNWMSDYTAFITAYGHTIHCLGHVKVVLDAFNAGRTPAEVQREHPKHHQDHCLEIVRRTIDCQPDLSLQIQTFDEKGEHTPFYDQSPHRCRDRSAVHSWLADRNLGFMRDEGTLYKAWSWPLPHLY